MATSALAGSLCGGICHEASDHGKAEAAAPSSPITTSHRFHAGYFQNVFFLKDVHQKQLLCLCVDAALVRTCISEKGLSVNVECLTAHLLKWTDSFLRPGHGSGAPQSCGQSARCRRAPDDLVVAPKSRLGRAPGLWNVPVMPTRPAPSLLGKTHFYKFDEPLRCRRLYLLTFSSCCPPPPPFPPSRGHFDERNAVRCPR